MYDDYEKNVTIDTPLLLESTFILEELFTYDTPEELWEYVMSDKSHIEKQIDKANEYIDSVLDDNLRDVYEKDGEMDDHLGCPAYPNCDINHSGCSRKMGSEVEWYGHR